MKRRLFIYILLIIGMLFYGNFFVLADGETDEVMDSGYNYNYNTENYQQTDIVDDGLAATGAGPEEVESRKGYVLPAVNELYKARLYRGYLQDRQDLGIYMPAGSSFKIRSSNVSSFKVDLITNDNKNGEQLGIVVEKDWVTITATADCVPFILTPNTDNYNSISYEIKDKTNTTTLPVFTKGGNEAEFLSTWTSGNQSYAIINGDRFTLMVPKGDKDSLTGTASDSFSTISELVNYYDNVILNYNNYTGLLANTQNKYDKDVNMKFFIKADKNGCGVACYYPCKYITASNEEGTLGGFLKKYNWGLLHELGHGYQAGFTYDNTTDLNLREVTNNFFAYEEAKKENKADGSIGILYGTKNGVAQTQELYISQINEAETFNELGAGLKLFIFENLFDKIHMIPAMKRASSEYRRIINEGENIKNSDLFGLYFSEATGYNVIPYFNRFKITPSDSTKEAIYPQKLPMVYPLAYIVGNQTANAIANAKGLRGIYSVVENEDIEDYVTSNNINRDIAFNITTENEQKLLHKKLYIKDSSNKIVREVVLDGRTVTLENVPVGIYYVAISNGTIDNLEYLLVTESSVKLTKDINYTLTEDDTIASQGDENNSSSNNNNSNSSSNSNNSSSDPEENYDGNDTNNNTSSSNLTNNSVKEDDTLLINLSYEYDPKTVDDKGEIISVPDTGKSSAIYITIGMILISLGIGIFVLKKREIFK